MKSEKEIKEKIIEHEKIRDRFAKSEKSFDSINTMAQSGFVAGLKWVVGIREEE